MQRKPKIIALAGSLRAGSFNKKLVKIAAEAARKAGADVTYIDLADYPLPVYDGDLEEKSGIPENGKKLKQLFIEQDGFLFACPEYNSSLSGAFKNVIDWISRPEPNQEYLIAFRNKTAAIMSASPGQLGGLRGLVAARAMLENIYTTVIPDQVCVSEADKAFQGDGRLIDQRKQESVEKLATKLVQTAARFVNA